MSTEVTSAEEIGFEIERRLDSRGVAWMNVNDRHCMVLDADHIVTSARESRAAGSAVEMTYLIPAAEYTIEVKAKRN